MKVTISSGRIQLFDLLKNQNPVISDAIFTSNIIKYRAYVYKMHMEDENYILSLNKYSK